MAEFACEVGACDRSRLSAHLCESRRLLVAPLEAMDRAFFRLPPQAVVIVTPVTEAADALALAAQKPGPLRARLPELSRQDAYVISHWLECSADRAYGRGWSHLGDGEVGAAVERIRQAWDGQFGVEGSPAERAALRTAAAWKRGKPRPPRRAVAALLGGGDGAPA